MKIISIILFALWLPTVVLADELPTGLQKQKLLQVLGSEAEMEEWEKDLLFMDVKSLPLDKLKKKYPLIDQDTLKDLKTTSTEIISSELP